MRMYMRWCKGTVDINFGIEQRVRQEGLEEQFNTMLKRGWRFASDAARILLTRMQALKVQIMRRISFFFCNSQRRGNDDRHKRTSSVVHVWE